MARIIVETSPADTALFRDGEALGRGSAALLVPFGKTVQLLASRAGFKSKELRIAVSGKEAEKRYLIQLEADPDAAITPPPETAVQRIMSLEARISMLESEIQSREILYRAVSTQSSSLGTERELLLRDAETSRKASEAARNETAAAEKQVAALESQMKELKAELEQEKEKVRQIQKLLQE